MTRSERRKELTMWGKVAMTVLGCALLALGALACGEVGSAPVARAQASEGGEADVRGACLGDFTETLLLTGELRADDGFEATVPRTPSWRVQIRWLIEDGTVVEAGDRLVELDNSTFAGDLEERKLTAAQTASEIDQRRAELAASEAELEQALAEKQAAVVKARSKAEVPAELLARREIEERRLALRRAELELEKAREELEAQQAAAQAELAEQRVGLEGSLREIAVAEKAIAELTAVAPYSGVAVVADHPWEGRKIQEGDSVWVGLALVRLPDLESMLVEAYLPDVDDGRLTPGAAVNLTLDAYPESSFGGTVRDLAQIARQEPGDSLRHFFRVIIQPETVDLERMRPGMSVKVEAQGRSYRQAVLVPRSAVSLGPDGLPTVRLGNGERRSVELGPCGERECVIESGIEPGLTLAVASPMPVSPGAG